jgi:hypothetical protein
VRSANSQSSRKTKKSQNEMMGPVSRGEVFNLIRSKLVANHHSTYPKFNQACIEPKNISLDITSDYYSTKKYLVVFVRNLFDFPTKQFSPKSSSSRVSTVRTIKSSKSSKPLSAKSQRNQEISDLLIISQVPFDFYQNGDYHKNQVNTPAWQADPNVSLTSNKSRLDVSSAVPSIRYARSHDKPRKLNDYLFVYRQSGTGIHVRLNT